MAQLIFDPEGYDFTLNLTYPINNKFLERERSLPRQTMKGFGFFRAVSTSAMKRVRGNLKLTLTNNERILVHQMISEHLVYGDTLRIVDAFGTFDVILDGATVSERYFPIFRGSGTLWQIEVPILAIAGDYGEAF